MCKNALLPAVVSAANLATLEYFLNRQGSLDSSSLLGFPVPNLSHLEKVLHLRNLQQER